uniref:Uncharacterized protein n=1 Tax=Octopus bimaculoides TaxID=37653 RepID=A0A0L8G9D8_OCTBM
MIIDNSCIEIVNINLYFFCNSNHHCCMTEKIYEFGQRDYPRTYHRSTLLMVSIAFDRKKNLNSSHCCSLHFS